MKILVTGATGFLGGHLTARLVRDGYEVRALARSAARAESIGRICEVAFGDLRDESSLKRAVQGVDAVFHAGAALSGSWADYEDVTIRGTERLLKTSLEAGVERFVHISTLAVYRTTGIPENATIDETREIEPHPERVGPYCRSKVEAERLAFDYCGRGLPVVVIRPGLIYGPGGKVFWPNIGYMAMRLCVVIGNGHAFLPLTYVENTVDALLRALNVKHAVGRAYHITDGFGLTKDRYLHHYMEATGVRLRIVHIPLWLLSVPAFASGFSGRFGITLPIPNRYALMSKFRGLRCDTGRARWELGWEPKVSTAEGLERTFAWLSRSDWPAPAIEAAG
jgi:nucleoside-diphosphate-sugar epimerase